MSCGDVSRARELLTQAVQFLDSSGGRNLSATRDQRRSSPEHFGHSARRLPFSGSRESSALAERSLLFNFGGKRKLGSGFTSSKKKRRWPLPFGIMSLYAFPTLSKIELQQHLKGLI